LSAGKNLRVINDKSQVLSYCLLSSHSLIAIDLHERLNKIGYVKVLKVSEHWADFKYHRL
jgi:hypothetical protein